MGDSELVEKAIEVTKNEEAKIDKKLKPYIEKFRGKNAILNTGGEKAWSIASALKDLGIKVIATSVAKSVESDIKKAKEILGEDIILMKSPASEQIKIVEEYGTDILLGGGRSLYTAFKRRNSFLNLAKDLDNVLDNPI
ncbi:nitrogenase component 1 [Lebetimonas sp. JH292]|uniref:nitrogenase component 1 n=1 Tax=Lebetimonas sp. JH292 TaxID=990068 RepID=UPI00138AFF83|nr:nitrogenase component 1 [Lebetimonas sp. JH292]